MTDIALSRTYRTRWPIASGYVLCWIIGLLIGGPSLAPDAKAADVQLAFAGSTSLLAFAVLVHGVAAVLLAALGWALLSERETRGIFPLSCAAACLSIAQLVGEVMLVSAPNALNAATVWEVISRVDGIKMLVLAGLVAAFHGGRSGRRVALTIISAAAFLALLVSGIGYLTLMPALMSTANVSLPLLLIWALAAMATRVSESRAHTHCV